MNLNHETISKLMSAYRDDRDTIGEIADAIMVFEDYHKSIFDLEVKKRLFAHGAMESDDYRELIPRLDRTRTITHNALLTQVNILNRIAAEAGLPPVYDGIVSEERPYRREVANAVLDYVQQIILNGS